MEGLSSENFFTRLDPGPSEAEGERGRLIPRIEVDCDPSISISSAPTLTGPFRRRQGSVGVSRTTMIAPQVPAQRFKVGFRETQAPHTKLSYSSPEISGGGRPEDEDSDAASSAMSLPAVWS